MSRMPTMPTVCSSASSAYYSELPRSSILGTSARLTTWSIPIVFFLHQSAIYEFSASAIALCHLHPWIWCGTRTLNDSIISICIAVMRCSTVTHVSRQWSILFCTMPLMLFPVGPIVLTIQVVGLNLDDLSMLAPMFAVSLDDDWVNLHDWVKLILFTHIPVFLDLLGFQLFRNYAVWRLSGLVVFAGGFAFLEGNDST